MRISRKEKRKAELERLKEILSRLPENKNYKVDIFPGINQVLGKLEAKRYINVRLRPGYDDPQRTGSPSPEKIKQYGAQIYVEPTQATKYDWRLIKEALVKIGFLYAGQGQTDWFLVLEP